LLAFAYFLSHTWLIPPRIAFSNINNISASVRNSNFTLDIFNNASQDKPGAEKYQAGSHL
jgi:hypothetical protein